MPTTKPKSSNSRRPNVARSDTNRSPFPFSAAPTKLTPFLRDLDKSRVYIVHLDKLPKRLKRKMFVVPVALNLAITLLLLWRLYAIYPTYIAYLMHMLGHTTATTVDVASQTWTQLIWISLKRSAMLLFDFSLFRILGSWPVNFAFALPSNTAVWRWSIGFGKIEICVRVSKGWGTEDLLGGPPSQPVGDSEIFKSKILASTDPLLLKGKTGFLMNNADWDLDYEMMIRATQLVRSKECDVEFADFEAVVIAHSPLGWLAWRAHESSTAEEAARKKIIVFRDRLNAMGKESLFFRWIELVQYESSGPEGLTPARQAEVLRKAKELFEAANVNFDEFVASLGGVSALPSVDRVAG